MLDLLAARDGSGTEEDKTDLDASEDLASIVKDSAHFPGFWGEDGAVDALRLRRLAGTSAAEAPWEGFLEWAGRALFQRNDPLPEDVLPAAAAAMAASAGWRRALDACLLRLPEGPLGRRAHRALSTLTLRVALEDALVPAAVRWLIPGGDALSSEESEAWQTAPWRPALLSLRAYHEYGNDAGVVHLTAGLVASRFRRGFRTAARRRRLDVAVPCWGAATLSATAQKVLRRALARLGDVDPWNLRGPGPSEWGGPDGWEVEVSLTRLLGGRSELARLVLLDDRLCLAAVWGLLGRPQSALAQLAGWKTAPIFAEAREALRRGLPGWREHGLPDEVPRGPEADDLFRTLGSTPDPSVALGSPHWMLPDGRGAHTNRLLKQGRRDEARRLRTILDRPDVRQKLEPLWILTGPEDTASVVALAQWLAVRVPSPSEREWLAFLEGQCRRIEATK